MEKPHSAWFQVRQGKCSPHCLARVLKGQIPAGHNARNRDGCQGAAARNGGEMFLFIDLAVHLRAGFAACIDSLELARMRIVYKVEGVSAKGAHLGIDNCENSARCHNGLYGVSSVMKDAAACLARQIVRGGDGCPGTCALLCHHEIRRFL